MVIRNSEKLVSLLWFAMLAPFAILIGVVIASCEQKRDLAAAEHRLAPAKQAPLSTDRMRTLPDVSARWVNPPAPYVPKPGTWE